MKEITGDLWHFHQHGLIVIPTNGAVNRHDECVMGRGVALQAKRRFPGLAVALGSMIRNNGNNVYEILPYNLCSFPVKHRWYELADPDLILRSTIQLSGVLAPEVYLPRVGCGNGGLRWDDVRPILERHLDDRFTVVSLP